MEQEATVLSRHRRTRVASRPALHPSMVAPTAPTVDCITRKNLVYMIFLYILVFSGLCSACAVALGEVKKEMRSGEKK